MSKGVQVLLGATQALSPYTSSFLTATKMYLPIYIKHVYSLPQGRQFKGLSSHSIHSKTIISRWFAILSARSGMWVLIDWPPVAEWIWPTSDHGTHILHSDVRHCTPPLSPILLFARTSHSPCSLTLGRVAHCGNIWVGYCGKNPSGGCTSSTGHFLLVCESA